MPEIKYNFLDSDNYTFDPAKIENVGPGTFKLLATVAPGTAYAYWTMDDNEEDEVFRDSSGNSRDLRFANLTSANKVPAKINNGLQGNAAPDSGFCRYGVGSAEFGFDRANPFSLECWLKYTGTTTQFFISKQSSAGVGYSVNTLSAGKIRFVIRDTATNVIVVETASTYNDGSFHHLAATYNGNSTETGMKLYVDNVLDTVVSVSGTLTNTIVDNNVSFQISGRDGSNDTINANTVMDEAVVYNREITPADVTFRYNGGAGTQVLPGAGTSFPTDNPTIQAKNGFEATELKNFLATIVETGNDKVKFVISVNNVDKWWDGGAIADSTGYIESNTAAEILANIAAFLDGTKARVNPKSFLHSDTGNSTPEISDLTIGYDAKTTVISLQTSEVSSILLDAEGNPIVGRTVKARMAYTINTNIITTSDYVSTVSDATGAWSLTLQIEDTEPDFLEWCINGKFYKTNFLLGIIKFSDLTIIEENNTLE